MIVKIEYSKLKNKRFRVTMDDGDTYDFGAPEPNTFIDHHSTTRKELYWNRHLGNKTEKILITNLIPSPATFSFWLLWGPHTSLKKNIENLNNLWKEKHLAKNK